MRTYNPAAPEQETPVDSVNIIGTGGIYATAEDLCRFAQVFTGETDLLSEAMREASFQPEYAGGQWLEAENNVVGYGLGWDCVDLYPFHLYDIQAVTKGGDTLLMHNALIVLPEIRAERGGLHLGRFRVPTARCWPPACCSTSWRKRASSPNA